MKTKSNRSSVRKERQANQEMQILQHTISEQEQTLQNYILQLDKLQRQKQELEQRVNKFKEQEEKQKRLRRKQIIAIQSIERKILLSGRLITLKEKFDAEMKELKEQHNSAMEGKERENIDLAEQLEQKKEEEKQKYQSKIKQLDQTRKEEIENQPNKQNNLIIKLLNSNRQTKTEDELQQTIVTKTEYENQLKTVKEELEKKKTMNYQSLRINRTKK